MSRSDKQAISVNPGTSYCYRDGTTTVQVIPPAGSRLWPLEGTWGCDPDEMTFLPTDRPLHRPPKYERPE